ncbi:hypothetical protein EDD21DRAFT_419821 [Dissophora ornata]|nr:hypothetical protein EDD21DRAFT_419821 [Dissophora ornata]
MFNEFLLQDEHEHRNFDAILKCYLAHVATLRKSGDADALKFKCTKEVIASFEKDYEEALTRRVATATSMQASDLLEDGLAQQAGGISPISITAVEPPRPSSCSSSSTSSVTPAISSPPSTTGATTPMRKKKKNVTETEEHPSIVRTASFTPVPSPALPVVTSTAAVSSSEGDSDNDEQDFYRFRERFTSMEDIYKWKLPSGQYAENILYEAGRQIRKQCSIHSFMIDMADKRTREAFSDEDWDAIKSRAAAIQDPVLHAAVERYLNKFDLSGSRNKLDKLKAATLIDGMKGVNLGYVGLAKEDQIQYELELVRKLMLDWWFLYRKESGPFTAGTLLSEAWWSSHCFSVLGHLPVKATRKKIGTKSDIFIRTLGHTSRDWSVVESGHLWDSFGNKVIGESRIKVSRQLHDILCHRAQETKWTDQFINEAKVVGIVTGGSMLTRMDLVFGGGRYTTILKGHGLFKMGETLNQFKQSLKVAKFLLQTRGLIVNLMTLFYQCMDDSEDDDEEQDYVNEYIASSPSGEYDTINLE